jgi:hypothetical protein
MTAMRIPINIWLKTRPVRSAAGNIRLALPVARERLGSPYHP